MATPPKPTAAPGYGFEWKLKGGKWTRSRKAGKPTPNNTGKSAPANPVNPKTGVNRFGFGPGKAADAPKAGKADVWQDTAKAGKTPKTSTAKKKTDTPKPSAPAKPRTTTKPAAKPAPTVDQSRTMWVKKGQKLSDGTTATKGYLAQYGKDTKKVSANVKIQTNTTSGKKAGETYSYNKGKNAGKKK